MQTEKRNTPAQAELLEFFSPVEVAGKHRQLKDVFRCVAFETEIALNTGGKDALFTLWYLIELPEQIKEQGEV